MVRRHGWQLPAHNLQVLGAGIVVEETLKRTHDPKEKISATKVIGGLVDGYLLGTFAVLLSTEKKTV